MDPRTPLATTEEVAAYLRRKPGTVKRWRHLGIGPRYIRGEGGEVLYDWADIDDWVAEKASAPRREREVA